MSRRTLRGNHHSQQRINLSKEGFLKGEISLDDISTVRSILTLVLLFSLATGLIGFS